MNDWQAVIIRSRSALHMTREKLKWKLAFFIAVFTECVEATIMRLTAEFVNKVQLAGRNMSRSFVIIVLGIMGATAFADDAETVARQQRLAGMRSRAEALRLRMGDKTDLRVRPEPLLRYSDPARTTTDGTLWLWEREGRPVAATCLFNDSREGFQWNFELATMCDEPLIVDGRPGWKWVPDGGKRSWIRMDEPAPEKTESARLVQMKGLLEQFRAEENNDGDRSELRLMPRRVHRYQSANQNVEDGAIFLFATGTNPEILVQIESIAATNRHWQIGFTRMAAAELRVFRGDKKVWEAGHIRSWNPKHEYFSHYGPDDAGMK